MGALALSVCLTLLTFVCYKINCWPFSRLAAAPSSCHGLSHTPTTSSANTDAAGKDKSTGDKGLCDNPPQRKVTDGPLGPQADDSRRKEISDSLQQADHRQAHIPKNIPILSANMIHDRTEDSRRMPPPEMPSSAAALRNQNSSLRRPHQTGPARLLATPNRTASLLPPPTASRGPGLAPRTAAAGTVATSSAAKPRRKVILAPGHSPLDWAALQKSSPNLSGVPYPQRITPQELAKMDGRKGRPAWSTFQGKVYNIGPYLPFHPGGEGELRRAAGKIGDKLFMEAHPWVNWEGMMGSCLVGILVEPEDGAGANSLDSMD